MTSPPSGGDTAGRAGARERRPLERGATLGRYVILDVLGQGGMGVVYKAYDPELDRAIALKLLCGEGEDAVAFQSRLLREAQALARLSHPNVVAVHDVGTLGDGVFVAMEFVDGQDLREWLKARPRSRAEILEALLAAGAGLAAAHGAGLVHRDFKPDNVMVGSDGRVRVLDFGLARVAVEPAAPGGALAAAAAEAATHAPAQQMLTSGTQVTAADTPRARESPPAPSGSTPSASTPSASRASASSGRGRLSAKLTQQGAVMGTPRYMAPEQHRGETADERADIFAFCVTAYEALYGAFPFAGEDLEAVRRNVYAGRVSDAPKGSSVPRWLRSAILRGLLPDRAARYPSMGELLVALRADPTVVRKRRLALAAALTLAAGAIVGWRVQRYHEAQSCAHSERLLAGVWDAPRRAAVRSAFLGSRLPYAAKVLESVEHAFDAYAHGWTAMRTEACEAAIVRGEQPRDLYQLRLACLSDRLTQLKTLSDLDGSGDPTVIEHAAQAAEALPKLATCADVAALRAPMDRPPSPAAAQRATEIRDRLSHASALRAAGEYQAAATVAGAALAEAEKLDYLPVLAEASYALGRLQWDLESTETSWASLRRAYAAAIASRHAELQARVAIELISVIGRANNHYEEAERWAEIAEAHARRLNDDELLAELYFNRSRLEGDRGRFADALTDVQHSLELLRRVFGPDHPRLASAYGRQSYLLYSLDRPAEALAPAQHALAIRERSLGPDHPEVATALDTLATAYGGLGQHEPELAHERRAVAILEHAGLESRLTVYYTNLADALIETARLDEAETYVRRGLAIELARKPQPVAYSLVFLWSTLAHIELAEKRPREGLTAAQHAVELAEKQGLQADLDVSLYLLGEAQRQLHDDKAVATLERALQVGKAAVGDQNVALAPAHLSLGRIFTERKAWARARRELELALGILQASPGHELELNDARFRLAQLLLASDPRQREQAIARAVQARDGYAKLEWLLPDVLPEVDRWLARNRGAAPAPEHAQASRTP